MFRTFLTLVGRPWLHINPEHIDRETNVNHNCNSFHEFPGVFDGRSLRMPLYRWVKFRSRHRTSLDNALQGYRLLPVIQSACNLNLALVDMKRQLVDMNWRAKSERNNTVLRR